MLLSLGANITAVYNIRYGVFTPCAEIVNSPGREFGVVSGGGQWRVAE
jgi:hypothetical protein